MCELLGLSSNVPTTLSLSLRKLAEHGGPPASIADGWGVAYYEGRDVRLIKDCASAEDSDWVRFIADHDLRSQIVVSHIRKATTMASAPIETPSRSSRTGGLRPPVRAQWLVARNPGSRELSVGGLLPGRRNGLRTCLLRPARANAFHLDYAWNRSAASRTHSSSRFVRGRAEDARTRKFPLLGWRYPVRSWRPPQERQHGKSQCCRIGVSPAILFAGSP